MNSTQNKAVEKALSKVVTEETASELASLEGEALVNTFNGLCEQMEYQNLMPEGSTVLGVLQGLYDLTQAQFLERMTIEEYQDILFQQVDLLASLLGIELED